MPLQFPLSLPAIRVKQPLGEFYATRIDARTLLEITYSNPLSVLGTASGDGGYPLLGAQRTEQAVRLKEIGRFIETAEAAFPNSIIIGANYTKDGELIDDDARRWRIEGRSANGCINLIIPTDEKLAAIVDGQHRLHGFEYAPIDKNMDLLCAVYLDLPNPFQAYLFATINFNQKKVDRSLAFELFGFDLEREPPDSWSPDKTAVFLCRKLNVDSDSPFHRHIIVAAQNDDLLFDNRLPDVDWAVSTATVVDGILSLISASPKRDKDLMHKTTTKGGRSRRVLADDAAPLRELYLADNDLAIYTAVKNYFLAVAQLFWTHAAPSSYIRKTVGIQALFDVLKMILVRDFKAGTRKNIRTTYFRELLQPAQNIDFSDTFFQASGKGRVRLKYTLALAANLVPEAQTSEDDRPHYVRLLGGALNEHARRFTRPLVTLRRRDSLSDYRVAQIAVTSKSNN